MQFEIECNTSKKQQICLICHQQFQMGEARLIVCNDLGESYGDVCPDCMARGGSWISSQFQLIHLRDYANTRASSPSSVNLFIAQE